MGHHKVMKKYTIALSLRQDKLLLITPFVDLAGMFRIETKSFTHSFRARQTPYQCVNTALFDAHYQHDNYSSM